MGLPRASLYFAALGLVLAGCGSESRMSSYSFRAPPDLSRAREFARDERHTFRYPLDNMADKPTTVSCVFGAWNDVGGERDYHAAEDYPDPPGTPVYAMAEGEVSFSGTAGGYGWLIIVDHPEPNLYSLYGHLSPSRWRKEEGPIRKGEVLAYLGDPHENGGSREEPLRPHLHFGIRAGLRTDYPGKGEWRWQAGWIEPKPSDVGWIRPSDVINTQLVPAGGFRNPEGNLLEIWGHELALIGAYVIGAACVLLFSVRRKKTRLLLFAACVLVAAGLVFRREGLQLAWILFALAGLLAAGWLYGRVRLRRAASRAQC